MVRLPPHKLRIGIDQHERVPHRLEFPRWLRWYGSGGGSSSASCLIQLEPVVLPLQTADYAVFAGKFGDPNCVVAAVETKRSMSELRTNLLTRDHQRLLREWKRFLRVPYRAVLLDMTATEVFTESSHVPEPMRVLDMLLRDCRRYSLELLLLPPGKTRQRTGEFVARWLLSCLCAWQNRRQTNGRIDLPGGVAQQPRDGTNGSSTRACGAGHHQRL